MPLPFFTASGATRRIPASLAALLVAATMHTAAAGAEPPRSDWSVLGRTSDVQHNSPLAQINDRTVVQLGLAWFADIPSKDGLVGNPLVVDGVAYQSGPSGNAYANDIRTGKLLWHFTAEPTLEGSSLATYWSIRHNRGVAIHEDKVIFAVGDCRLIAVDRKKGTKVWEVAACDRAGTYGITAAPRVGGGMVFTGNNCIDSGAERGYVDAYDAKTGTRRWRFYTVPNEPSKGQENKALEMAAKTWGTEWWTKTRGCGSAWDALTYDAKLNLLYIGTGGPAPFSPKDRAADAGDELFTNSIVAVRADTGEYVWHYKVTPNDGWNFDATMQMMLADLKIGGKPRRVLMTAPKNGFFYVLDARTGKFISAKNVTPVNWASHIDPKTGRPVRLRDANYWERPTEPTVVSPGPYGARNWQAMAYNERTGLVYFPVIVAPTLIEPDPNAKVGGISFDMYYGSRGDKKWPAYGELVAWDPVTQKERWRVRQPKPINGGTLTTAGNLVFQGTADGKFAAYAADTGKQLWSFDAGASIQSAPTTVEIDGEQIVLVASGSATAATTGRYMAMYGSNPDNRSPARLLAFKLGGSAQLPATQDKLVLEKPPRPRQPEEQARIGRNRYEASFCVDCHGLDGKSAVGSVPDLRRASPETHDLFLGIVIGGLRKEKGMPAFHELSVPDALAIQAYILNQAWDSYDAQQSGKK